MPKPPELTVACIKQDAETSTQKSAARLLAMAFEMLQIVRSVKDPRSGQPIEMRIGIHTGSIVAGTAADTQSSRDHATAHSVNPMSTQSSQSS